MGVVSVFAYATGIIALVGFLLQPGCTMVEQVSVEREGKSQREGHGDHKLPNRYIGQDVIHQVRGARRHSPAQTARIHGSGITAKGHNMVLATSREKGRPW